jgi:hypothetical protein
MAAEVVRAVLDHVWSALEPLGHPCALMGGLALAAWNHPRATRDVDILIGIESANIDAVLDSLLTAKCRPKSDPPLKKVGKLHFAQFLYTPPGEFYDVQFDLWLADSELHKSGIARRVRRDIPGVTRPIDVLNCEDLILFKLVAGRIIDRADAAMLLRENREVIDFAYLRGWVSQLQLTRVFTEIWGEAFPSESPPTQLPSS